VTFDVIVAGAGPAGSTTAALLARQGLKVLLADRARFPRPKPCGDYLNPGCVALLDRLGGGAAVRRPPAPVPGMRIAGPRGAEVVARFSRVHGLAIERGALDHHLLAQASAAGAEVHQDARLVRVERGEAGVRITLVRGAGRARAEEHRARLLVGADGLRSAAARLAGLGGVPRAGRFAVGGYVEGVAPADGLRPAPGELHLGPEAYCGVAFLPGGVANITAAVPPRMLRAWRGRLAAGYWELLRSFPGLGPRLRGARLVAPLRAAGPLGFFRRRPTAPGVLLVGDAAAFCDPMTGQGVYLAVRGAALAAEAAARALGRGGPSARNLAPYGRACRRAFAGPFVLAAVLGRLAFCAPLAERMIRRMAGRPDLAARFIDAAGAAAPAASAFHPRFLGALLGAGA
jgi:flavin-dependent dehydrogenase